MSVIMDLTPGQYRAAFGAALKMRRSCRFLEEKDEYVFTIRANAGIIELFGGGAYADESAGGDTAAEKRRLD